MKTLLSSSLTRVGLLALLGCSQALRPAFRFDQFQKADIPCRPLVLRAFRSGEARTLQASPTFDGPDRNYHHPAFNPQNPDEVAYYMSVDKAWNALSKREKHLSGTWVVNLRTKRRYQVSKAYESFGYRTRPGGYNWLTYSDEGKTWSMNTQNGSRHQLTHSLAHEWPQWSPDGQRLVAQRVRLWHYPGINHNPLVLLDSAGQRIPTPGLEVQKGPPGPWSPDGRWLLLTDSASAETAVGLYDFHTSQVRFIDLSPHHFYLSPHHFFGDGAWLPDSQGFVWCTNDGVFRTSLVTGITAQLRTGCESRVYASPSVASDGKLLIVERTDMHVAAECDSICVYRETNLWTMNLDGSNERKMVFRKHRR